MIYFFSCNSNLVSVESSVSASGILPERPSLSHTKLGRLNLPQSSLHNNTTHVSLSQCLLVQSPCSVQVTPRLPASVGDAEGLALGDADGDVDGLELGDADGYSVGCTSHTPPLHTVTIGTQSRSRAHACVSPHGGQSGPPQLRSVSSSFVDPSPQWAGAHAFTSSYTLSAFKRHVSKHISLAQS